MKTLAFLEKLKNNQKNQIHSHELDEFIGLFCVEIDDNLYFSPEEDILKEIAEEYLNTHGEITSLDFKNHLRENFIIGISQREVSDFLNTHYSHLEFEWETEHGKRFKKYFSPKNDKDDTPFDLMANDCPAIAVDMLFSNDELEGLIEINLGDDNGDNIVLEPNDSIMHNICEEHINQVGYITARDLKTSLRAHGFYGTQKGCEYWLKNNYKDFDREIEIIEYDSKKGSFLKYCYIPIPTDEELEDMLKDEDLKKYPEPSEECVKLAIQEILKSLGKITARDLKLYLRNKGQYATQKGCEAQLKSFKDSFNLLVEEANKHLVYFENKDIAQKITDDGKKIVRKFRDLFNKMMGE